MLTQRDLDLRSLALHRLAAGRLQRDPSLLKRAAQVIVEWRQASAPGRRFVLDRWDDLIQQGVDACIRAAVEDSESAAALRQLSPLVRLLTLDERFAVLKQWQSHGVSLASRNSNDR